jgi:hypothetical protein
MQLSFFSSFFSFLLEEPQKCVPVDGEQLMGMTRQEGPACSYLGDLARVIWARLDSKSGGSARGNKGNLRESLTYRITILPVSMACDAMYSFSICQYPPINCEPH